MSTVEWTIPPWTGHRRGMRIVGFGTYDVTRHPRPGIILDGLRAWGDDVLEINEPLGLSTAERVEILNRPVLLYRLVFAVGRAWLRLARRLWRLRGEPMDAIFVGYLGHFDVVLARLVR